MNMGTLRFFSAIALFIYLIVPYTPQAVHHKPKFTIYHQYKQDPYSQYSEPQSDIEVCIIDASFTYNVDPLLIRAIIKAESDFNPRAVSDRGAVGLMQLMPATASDMGVQDPFDPRDNIFGGVRYIAWLYKIFDGDIDLVLAGYNAGPNRVLSLRRIPEIPETKHFVKKVKGYYYGLASLENF